MSTENLALEAAVRLVLCGFLNEEQEIIQNYESITHNINVGCFGEVTDPLPKEKEAIISLLKECLAPLDRTTGLYVVPQPPDEKTCTPPKPLD